ncbi:AMP-binding protein [uncultured Cetobacterium sp.]|uniref:AMP-binding protein n=1 Tax=uncultured Cetobacterium sp. TaxID=527638 RepID=UPI002604E84F|nr:AMP-binding protein [uncultured Cetobacterium sp.]
MNFIYDRKKTAVVFKNEEYSYEKLIKMSKKMSSLMELQKEERVAIFMENRVEYMSSILGVWDKKGTCTNLDAGYDADQLAYVFRDSSPKYILTSNENIEIAKSAKELTKSNILIINIDEIDFTKEVEIKNMSIEALDKDAVAVMLYTSGTTGNPKGVMLTYDNLMSNIEAVKEIDLVTESDNILAMLPSIMYYL